MSARCLALAGFLFLSVPAGAQSQAGKVTPRTSIYSRHLSMRDALRAMLRNAGLGYEVRGDSPDVPVSLSLRDVPLADAIRVLERHAGFSWSGVAVTEQNGTYAIASPTPLRPVSGAARPAVLPEAQPEASLLQNRAVEVAGLHLAEALERHFEAADVSFALDPDVPDAIIPALSVEPVSLWAGIQRVLQSARPAAGELYVARIGEIYVISRRSAASAIAAPKVDTEPLPEIHLLLREMSLRVAIDTVFRGTPYQYAVNPDVPNVPVTLEIREQGIARALRALVRAAGKQVPGLTYSKG